MPKSKQMRALNKNYDLSDILNSRSRPKYNFEQLEQGSSISIESLTIKEARKIRLSVFLALKRYLKKQDKNWNVSSYVYRKVARIKIETKNNL